MGVTVPIGGDVVKGLRRTYLYRVYFKVSRPRASTSPDHVLGISVAALGYGCSMVRDDPARVCREVRAYAVLSQRELARRAGVSPATITRIESGRMQPTVATLAKIVRAAGMELDLVVSDPDPDQRKAMAHRAGLSIEDRFREVANIDRFRKAIAGD